VTSSYLEGDHNALADWGYNRDKKRGKKQIVIGLLCDEEGEPVSVEVFTGNTADPQTFGDQVKKVAERSGCRRVTFVGDRGMSKESAPIGRGFKNPPIGGSRPCPPECADSEGRVPSPLA
jgi:transposase